MYEDDKKLLGGRKLFSIGLLAMAALLASLGAPHLHAQSDTGAISGTATDATGGVIPGAAVVATTKTTDSSFRLKPTRPVSSPSWPCRAATIQP